MRVLSAAMLLFLGATPGNAQEKPHDGGEIPWTRFGRKDTEKFHQFLEQAKEKAKPVLVFFT
jgi:hypothetical protein